MIKGKKKRIEGGGREKERKSGERDTRGILLIWTTDYYSAENKRV